MQENDINFTQILLVFIQENGSLSLAIYKIQYSKTLIADTELIQRYGDLVVGSNSS
jgi:hypothetical protein